MQYGEDTVEFMRKCLEIDTYKRASVKALLDSPYFNEFSEEKKNSDMISSQAKDIKKISTVKLKVQDSYKEIHKKKPSPDVPKKIKGRDYSLMLKNDSFYVKHESIRDRLPSITSKNTIRPRKISPESILSINKSRYAAKSTLKHLYIDRDSLLPRNHSLIHDTSHETISKNSFEGNNLTHRHLKRDPEVLITSQKSNKLFKRQFPRNINYIDKKYMLFKSQGNSNMTPR